MANLTTPSKNPGNQYTSAELNERTNWMNSPSKSLGVFNPIMNFDSSGHYDNYTLTGNIVLTASGIENGNFRTVRITADGASTITFGAGITEVITDFTGPLLAGNYWFYMASINGGVHVSIPEAQTIVVAPPTILTALTAGANNYIDVNMSEGIYGANDGSTPAALSDFNVVFAQNTGTATNWVATSAKQNDSNVEGSATALAGGESTVRIFGTLTGTADGQETLTVSPIDGASLFNSQGVAMDAGESVQDNLYLPTSLGADLKLWLDATTIGTDGSVVDGSNNVTTWADKSGNNRDFDGTGHAPLWDTIDKITFDGVSEYLINTADIADFSSDNQGVWFVVCSTSAFTRSVALSRTGENGHYVSMARWPSEAEPNGNDEGILMNDGTNTNQVTYDNTVNIDGQTTLLAVSSNGSIYQIYQNGQLRAKRVGAGADNGDWHSAVTSATQITISYLSQLSTFYYASDIKEILYTQLISAEEITRVFEYLNDKHSIY